MWSVLVLFLFLFSFFSTTKVCNQKFLIKKKFLITNHLFTLSLIMIYVFVGKIVSLGVVWSLKLQQISILSATFAKQSCNILSPLRAVVPLKRRPLFLVFVATLLFLNWWWCWLSWVGCFVNLQIFAIILSPVEKG